MGLGLSVETRTGENEPMCSQMRCGARAAVIEEAHGARRGVGAVERVGHVEHAAVGLVFFVADDEGSGGGGVLESLSVEVISWWVETGFSGGTGVSFSGAFSLEGAASAWGSASGAWACGWAGGARLLRGGGGSEIQRSQGGKGDREKACGKISLKRISVGDMDV